MIVKKSIITLCISLFFYGCADTKGSGDSSIPVTGVKLNKEYTTIQIENSEPIYATVSPHGANSSDLTWKSSDETVATIIPADDGSAVIMAVGKGSTIVTVYTEGKLFSDSCEVEVTLGSVDLVGISVLPETVTLNKNASRQLTVTFSPPNATNQSLSWTSSDPEKVSVSGAGVITANYGTSVDNPVVITATSVYTSSDSSVISDSCAVTVNVPVQGISLDCPEQIYYNSSHTISVIFDPSDASNQEVAWSSGIPDIVDVVKNTGSPNSATIVGNSIGTTTIIGISDETGESVSSEIEVVAEYKALVGISLPSSAQVEVAQNLTISPTLLPADNTAEIVASWSSGNELVATIDESTGVITGVSVGSCTIYLNINGFTASCELNVTQATPKSVSLSATSLSISDNGTVTLNASVYPAIADQTVFWNSSNTDVATVAGGVITGKSAGVSLITATTSNGYSASCYLIVRSSDAELTNLIVRNGVLRPIFSASNSDTYYLDAPLLSSQSQELIKLSVSQTNAEVLFDYDSSSGLSVEDLTDSTGYYVVSGLSVGSNLISIEVTAPDGVTQKNFQVDIFRAVPVFKTGQTVAYSQVYSGGILVNGPDDGYYQYGVSKTGVFVSNAETVTDSSTGLMWKTGYVSGNLESLLNSANDANSSSLAGYNDWRIPNVLELRSLINYSVSLSSRISSLNIGSVSIDGDGDTRLICSNLYFPDNSYSWYVSQKLYNLLTDSSTGTQGSFLVRGSGSLPSISSSAASSSVSWPSTRFSNNSDGTITDNMTGLLWLQNATAAGSNASVVWNNALSDLFLDPEIAGHTGWRMPNMNEMMTLLNYSVEDPAAWLITQGFTNTSHVFLTSTTDFSNTSNFYAFDFTSGRVYSCPKVTAQYCWIVKGSNN